MRLKYILTAVLLLISATSSSATSGGSSSDKTISVCQIQYTALGKSANWHWNYVYAVETNSDGSVEKITKLGRETHLPFVEEDKIVECIKTWRLSPSGRHSVVFSIGTNGNENYISIVDPNHDSIKLVL